MLSQLRTDKARMQSSHGQQAAWGDNASACPSFGFEAGMWGSGRTLLQCNLETATLTAILRPKLGPGLLHTKNYAGIFSLNESGNRWERILHLILPKRLRTHGRCIVPMSLGLVSLKTRLANGRKNWPQNSITKNSITNPTCKEQQHRSRGMSKSSHRQSWALSILQSLVKAERSIHFDV